MATRSGSGTTGGRGPSDGRLGPPSEEEILGGDDALGQMSDAIGLKRLVPPIQPIEEAPEEPAPGAPIAPIITPPPVQQTPLQRPSILEPTEEVAPPQEQAQVPEQQPPVQQQDFIPDDLIVQLDDLNVGQPGQVYSQAGIRELLAERVGEDTDVFRKYSAYVDALDSGTSTDYINNVVARNPATSKLEDVLFAGSFDFETGVQLPPQELRDRLERIINSTQELERTLGIDTDSAAIDALAFIKNEEDARRSGVPSESVTQQAPDLADGISQTPQRTNEDFNREVLDDEKDERERNVRRPELYESSEGQNQVRVHGSETDNAQDGSETRQVGATPPQGVNQSPTGLLQGEPVGDFGVQEQQRIQEEQQRRQLQERTLQQRQLEQQQGLFDALSSPQGQQTQQQTGQQAEQAPRRQPPGPRMTQTDAFPDAPVTPQPQQDQNALAQELIRMAAQNRASQREGGQPQQQPATGQQAPRSPKELVANMAEQNRAKSETEPQATAEGAQTSTEATPTPTEEAKPRNLKEQIKGMEEKAKAKPKAEEKGETEGGGKPKAKKKEPKEKKSKTRERLAGLGFNLDAKQGMTYDAVSDTLRDAFGFSKGDKEGESFIVETSNLISDTMRNIRGAEVAAKNIKTTMDAYRNQDLPISHDRKVPPDMARGIAKKAVEAYNNVMEGKATEADLLVHIENLSVPWVSEQTRDEFIEILKTPKDKRKKSDQQEIEYKLMAINTLGRQAKAMNKVINMENLNEGDIKSLVRATKMAEMGVAMYFFRYSELGLKIQQRLFDKSASLTQLMMNVDPEFRGDRYEAAMYIKEIQEMANDSTTIHGKIAAKAEKRKQRVAEIMDALEAKGVSRNDVGKFLIAQHLDERNKVLKNKKMRGSVDEVTKLFDAHLSDLYEGDSTDFEPPERWMSEAEAKEVMEQFQDVSEMKEMSKIIQEINGETLQGMLDNNMISKSDYDNIKEAYKYYVPYRRKGKEKVGTDSFSEMMRGLSPRYLKGAEGSDIPILDPVAMSLYNAAMTDYKGRLNMRQVKLAEYMLKNGALKTERRPGMEVRDKEVKAFYDKVVESSSMRETKEFVFVVQGDTKYRTDERRPDEPRLVFRIGGKVVNMVPAKESISSGFAMRNAINFLSGQPPGVMSNYISSTLGNLTRGWSALQTMYNVPFFAVLNPTRDVQTAMYNMWLVESDKELMLKVLTGVPKAVTSGRSYLFGKESKSNKKGQQEYLDAWQEAVDEGVLTGLNASVKDMSDAAAIFKKEMRSAGLEVSLDTEIKDFKSYLGKAANLTKDGLKSIDKFVDNANKLSENAVRISYYKEKKAAELALAKKEGLSDKEAETRARSKAGLAAKDLTVNFDRSGDWGRTLSSTFAFFNPAVQGSSIMFNKTRKARGRRIGEAMAVQIGMALAASINNSGCEKYKQIPPYVKDRFLVYMTDCEKGNYVALPMAYGLNFPIRVFTSVMDKMTGGMRHDDGLISASLRSFTTGFVPIQGEGVMDFVMPTIPKPLLQGSTNRNAFGNRIDSHSDQQNTESMRRLIDRHEHGAIANALADITSPVLNLSPAQIDNALKYWFTGTGAANQFVRPWEAYKERQTSKAAINKIPALKYFFHQGTEQDVNSYYFSVYEKVSAMRSNIKNLEETIENSKGRDKWKREKELRDFREEHESLVRLTESSLWRGNGARISRLSKEAKTALIKKEYSKYNSLTSRINKMALTSISLFNSAYDSK